MKKTSKLSKLWILKLKINNHEISLSNLDKVLFSEDNITKGDIINYYNKISPYIIPLISNRPLTLKRYPKGIDSEGFFQKSAPDYLPNWIETIIVENKTGGDTNYILCNNKETLVYLANQSLIEPHIWLSKADKLDYPDRLIFDFDSEKPQFKKICKSAKLLKQKLDALKLESLVMTTGSKGLHVIVPLNLRKNTFDQVKNFAKKLSIQLLEENPNMLTLELSKEKRGNKIFIDFLRNTFGQTGVAPYGVRAKPGAPIATPLSWDELDDLKLTAQKYNIKNIFKRLSKIKDPWQNINKIKQVIPKI